MHGELLKVHPTKTVGPQVTLGELLKVHPNRRHFAGISTATTTSGMPGRGGASCQGGLTQATSDHPMAQWRTLCRRRTAESPPLTEKHGGLLKVHPTQTVGPEMTRGELLKVHQRASLRGHLGRHNNVGPARAEVDGGLPGGAILDAAAS